MRFVLLACLVLGACRCGDDGSAATTATSVPTQEARARLELGDDVGTLSAPALAIAWLGDGAVVGRRGAFSIGGRDLPAPAYLGGPIDVHAGVARAWPYELGDEMPTELPIPEGPPIVGARRTSHGWIALRGAADERELVTLDVTTPRPTVSAVRASVAGTTLLAFDDHRIAAVGTRAWVVEANGARELDPPRYEVRAAGFAGDRLLALDAMGALVVWSASRGTHTTLVAHLGAASALDVRGDHLATGGTDGRVAVWRLGDLPTNDTTNDVPNDTTNDVPSATEPVAETTFAGTVDALVWTDDTTLVAAVTEGRRSRLVRLRLQSRDR